MAAASYPDGLNPARIALPPAILLSGHDINHLLGGWGYWLVFAVVLMQSAGVPVPGTTVLGAAAIYAAATHHLAIAGIIAAAAIAAVAGGTIGFAVGRSGGWKFVNCYGHRVGMTPARLEAGQRFFARHGGKVVFFGRFVTGLRTWGAFIAGANRMQWRWFLWFNVAGGVTWSVVNGLGYFYFGRLLTHASEGVDIALAIIGIAWIAASAAYVRRRVGNARETHRQRAARTVTGEGNSLGDS